MSTPTFYGAKPLEPLSSCPNSESKTAFFSLLPRVVKQLLHAFVRCQIRRLDRRIAALELDDRFLH